MDTKGIETARRHPDHLHESHGGKQLQNADRTMRHERRMTKAAPILVSPHGQYIWIDAMRGIAALCVVISHYHHFYLADALDRPNLPPPSTYPYAAMLEPVFRHGHYAVELFWVISGFVFAHVYLKRPSGLRAFAGARIARLYPLHLATLLAVAVLQAISLAKVGHWQIYGNNDLRHFILNLGMASHLSTWSRGLSFNGPIWSVSLEMGAYALFYISLGMLRRTGPWLPAALAVAFFALGTSDFRPPLLRMNVFVCAAHFFAGVLVYQLHARCHGNRHMMAVLALGLLCTSGAAMYSRSEPLITMTVFATLVLGAATLDRVTRPMAGQLKTLGDLSYSIYLVHVPMQMALLLCLDLFLNGTRGFTASPLTLPVYIVTVIWVSLIVHRRFEKPAGAFLRKHLARRGPQSSPEMSLDRSR